MRLLPLIAFLLVVAAVAVVVIPFMAINPATAQDAGDIRIGYLFMRWGSTINLLLMFLGIGALASLWKQTTGVLSRLPIIIGGLVLALATIGARVVPVQMMFAPIDELRWAQINQAAHLEADDLVLGVESGGESSAYPVPIVAYHHIVNDRLAGEPFVVTY